MTGPMPWTVRRNEVVLQHDDESDGDAMTDLAVAGAMDVMMRWMTMQMRAAWVKGALAAAAVAPHAMVVVVRYEGEQVAC